jgi:hypothetical protein
MKSYHQCLLAAFMIAVPAASCLAAETPDAGATQVARLSAALAGSIDPKLAQAILKGPCGLQDWSQSSVCMGGGINAEETTVAVEDHKIVVTEPYEIVVQHFEGHDRTVYGDSDKYHHKKQKYTIKTKDLGADFVVMTPVGMGTVLVDKALYQQADPKAAVVGSANLARAVAAAANAVHSQAQAEASARTAKSISDNLSAGK